MTPKLTGEGGRVGIRQNIYTSGFFRTQKFTPKVRDSRQIQCYQKGMIRDKFNAKKNKKSRAELVVPCSTHCWHLVNLSWQLSSKLTCRKLDLATSQLARLQFAICNLQLATCSVLGRQLSSNLCDGAGGGSRLIYLVPWNRGLKSNI